MGSYDSAIPTIGELDGSINRPDVDSKGAERGPKEHRLHFPVQEVATGGWIVVRTLEGLVIEVTVNELDSEEHVNGNGNHLEDDTTQHDFPSHIWVLVVTGGGGCYGATNALDAEGNQVSGQEGDGVCGLKINISSETMAPRDLHSLGFRRL